jgi:hypothetical protein
MMREALLEPIISSVRKGTALSRFQILDYFADWDVIPFEFEGRHVCTTVAKGTEVHIALVSDWRPKASLRGAVRSFLRPVFERHGFLTTRISHGRLAQKEFVKRIGFKPTWKDGDVEYYLLGSLPFERKL